MFTLLNPLSLWLGALLAAPLIIHFLGRQRLRKQPFPSLLLVREKFSRTMHRHRLKNLLLLLIRTLLILCLLLALGHPVLEGRGGAPAHPGTLMALLHNGIYGKLGSASAGEPERPDALQRQRGLIRRLDSTGGKKTLVVPIIPEGAGGMDVSERFGSYREALIRLSAALPPGAGDLQWHIPVFAWADLESAGEILAGAMREHPGLQVVFSDFGAEGARVNAFAGVRATPSPRAPTVTLLARLHPSLSGPPAKMQTYLGGGLYQETAATAASAEITLPLGEGPRTAGKLALTGGPGFANAEYHFCFPNPGRLVLAHLGSTLASLPSLGRENYFRQIAHVGAPKEIPWESARPGSAAPGSLRLVYLANPRNTDAAAYSRLVEFVKRGGRLIVGTGRDSDIPLLNRFLLEPLRLGRLGVLTETPGTGVQADRAALARLGPMPGETGPLGTVRKRFACAAEKETEILLSQAGEPVLAARDFHQGKVLLWTTDIDDLDWTDLGVNPVTPLIHQAFQEAGAQGMTANREVHSDSVYRLSLDGGPDAGGRPEIRDPENRPFTRIREDGARLRIGPFDRLGLYRIAAGKDTATFAVNLAPREYPGEDWEAWNADRKMEFLRGLQPFRKRLVVSDPEAAIGARAAVRPLWKALFLVAILLLFLEGGISAAYALRRNQGRAEKPVQGQ